MLGVSHLTISTHSDSRIRAHDRTQKLQTALIAATCVSNASEDLVALLLSASPEPNANMCDEVRCPHSRSCHSAHAFSLTLCKLPFPSQERKKPLWWACFHGSPKIVEQLLPITDGKDATASVRKL